MPFSYGGKSTKYALKIVDVYFFFVIFIWMVILKNEQEGLLFFGIGVFNEIIGVAVCVFNVCMQI